MVMRPLLLHASSKALIHNRRRVLHFVFGASEIDGPPPLAELCAGRRDRGLSGESALLAHGSWLMAGRVCV